MNIGRRVLLIGSTALLALAASLPASAPAGKRMVFGGGPAGGTFQIVANAIQTFGPIKASEDYTIKVQSSASSLGKVGDVVELLELLPRLPIPG